MKIHAIVLGLTLAITACALRPIDLRQSLQLRVASAPTEVGAGEPMEVTFTLANVSDRELRLCSPNGVSIVLQSSGQPPWPLLLHGMTTDTECSGPITLQPSGTHEFTEKGVIRRSWPEGAAELVGKISLWCRSSSRCADTQLETTHPLHIRAAAN
jgi:hypothetical protein